MIKLIASDLDGTLLQNGAKALNPEIFEIIRALKKQGILFVAASGRQYASLRRLFYEVADEIAYICENGAVVLYQGKVLQKITMEPALCNEIIREIQKFEGCEVLYSGENMSYVQPKDPEFAVYLKDKIQNNVQIVDNLLKVKDPCVKLAIYRKEGITKELEIHFKEKFGNRVTPAVSGLAWIDMLLPEADKGIGVRCFMEQFHLKSEECMAFGDQANDLAMLASVGVSYAMENGTEKVKKQAKFRCYRVEDTLKQLLKEVECSNDSILMNI